MPTTSLPESLPVAEQVNRVPLTAHREPESEEAAKMKISLENLADESAYLVHHWVCFLSESQLQPNNAASSSPSFAYLQLGFTYAVV